MDRIIKKTQALVVGCSAAAREAAATACSAGAQTMMLDAAGITEPIHAVEAVSNVTLDKIILYPEGRVAGVMGHQNADGRKVIVNCDAVVLTPDALAAYQGLCLAFGAVEEAGGLKMKSNGLLLNAEGKEIGGVFVMTSPTETGSAAGAYAVFVDETIYARFRAHPMVHQEPVIEGEYYLTILGMPGVPKHHIVIHNDNGVYSGTHETENDCQTMQNVRMENGYICWDLWSGTTSSELFTFQLKAYGNMFLGGTWRIDMENAHRTPVMMESTKPMNPFGPPKD